MSFPPTFPTSDRLLNCAMLMTSEKNTTGETMILSALMNIVRPGSSTMSFRAMYASCGTASLQRTPRRTAASRQLIVWYRKE